MPIDNQPDMDTYLTNVFDQLDVYNKAESENSRVLEVALIATCVVVSIPIFLMLGPLLLLVEMKIAEKLGAHASPTRAQPSRRQPIAVEVKTEEIEQTKTTTVGGFLKRRFKLEG